MVARVKGEAERQGVSIDHVQQGVRKEIS